MKMKKLVGIFCLVFAVFILATTAVFAKDPESQKIVNVERGTTVDNDYFANGDVVTISGTVNGDVYVIGEKVVVDGQMVEDRANVNQEKLAQGIVFPVLFIHGDQDERVPLDDSKRIVELSDGEAELYIPKGEGHVFKEKLGEIVERTTSWFVKYL